MGRVEDVRQLPHVTSARIEPETEGRPSITEAPDGRPAAPDTGGEESCRSPAFTPETPECVAALEQSLCQEDYESPQQQAMAENLARREADHELISTLARSGFAGPAQDVMFEAELAAYGYPVMMAWTRTGGLLAVRLPGGCGGEAAGRQVPGHQLVNVAELGVTIGMLLALDGLCVPLQGVPELVFEQLPHLVRADRPARRRQRIGQVLRRLGRPPQRMHRIAPATGIDQLLQLTCQFRIHMLHRLAAGTRPPHPAVRLEAALPAPAPPATRCPDATRSTVRPY